MKRILIDSFVGCMKGKVLLFGVLVFLTNSSSAQVVTENIHFDNFVSGSNNDLVNYFSNGNGLTAISTNGITGGSVDTPDSINWGNDNAIYCSRFHHNIGDTLLASICFKFSTNTQPSSFQRAVSLWLIPYADFNHYLIGTINYNQKMELISYGWSNNGGPVATLVNGHWYRYVLRAIMVGGVNDLVDVNASIFDLGTSGIATPTLVNSTGGTFTDNTLVTDTLIQLSMTGTSYGGATLLDDFQFHGRKGVSNCNTTVGINESLYSNEFTVFPNPADQYIYIDKEFLLNSSFNELNIYNNTGQLIIQKHLDETQQYIDVQNLKPGIYFVQLLSDGKIIRRKVVIMH